jgi:hypothetical protein
MALADYEDKYDRLTTWEKISLGLRPFAIPAVNECANKALREAAKRFPKPTLHNGRGDAFRHAYWSALMTREIGFLNTKAITDSHEEGPGIDPAEREMDLHNNLQGMVIGIRNRGASDDQLAEHCEEALRAGKLRVLKP